MLTVESIKAMLNDGAANIKYVKVKDEFRYAVAGGPVEHKQLVREGESPTSAGFFSLFKDDFFYLHSMASASLQLGPLDEDAELLKTIFQSMKLKKGSNRSGIPFDNEQIGCKVME